MNFILIGGIGCKEPFLWRIEQFGFSFRIAITQHPCRRMSGFFDASHKFNFPATTEALVLEPGGFLR